MGKSGDEGIDGTIKEGQTWLGYYLHSSVKPVGNVVGRPELQKFVGALAGQGAKKGISLPLQISQKKQSNIHLEMKQKLF